MTYKPTLLIVGAGIIGLSSALHALNQFDVYIVEKNNFIGEGASGRSSEVIHSGIYYKAGLQKAKFCVEGNKQIYEFCQEHSIPHKNTGKVIVAQGNEELETLNHLFEMAYKNSIQNVRMVNGLTLQEGFTHLEKLIQEPNIFCDSALYIPSTGIFDTASFVKKHAQLYEARSGNSIALNSKIVGIGTETKIKVHIENQRVMEFDYLLNATGVFVDKIIKMFDPTWEDCITPVVGQAMILNPNRDNLRTTMPVYGVPRTWMIDGKETHTTGPHTTPTLDGRITLGPVYRNANHEEDHEVLSDKDNFLLPFFPSIKTDDLSKHQAGTQAKHPSKDFVIHWHSDNIVSVLGTDSPGLTASGPLGKEIANQLESRL
ncbi:FAD-dependent oxidoreductase [Candidatus Woesearchaeota archaeon]|nr:FAD-dependent oxidoreductase [Candidatus Woesearchaeota archaeon]